MQKVIIITATAAVNATFLVQLPSNMCNQMSRLPTRAVTPSISLHGGASGARPRRAVAAHCQYGSKNCDELSSPARPVHVEIVALLEHLTDPQLCQFETFLQLLATLTFGTLEFHVWNSMPGTCKFQAQRRHSAPFQT